MTTIASRLMKSLAVCASSGIMLLCPPAIAQSRALDYLSAKSSTDLLQLLQESPLGTTERQEILIGILNKGLPRSEDNLRKVRENLAKSGAPEEKVQLTRLLASMYVPGARTQENMTIEKDIKSMVRSADVRIAKSAAFEYSRMVYPPDRHEFLRQAWADKILNDEEYFGELAHGLRFAPDQDQRSMFAELDAAKNQHAYGILASTFASREAIDQLHSGAQARLFKLLAANEPAFPLPLDNFGLIDAIRYTFWLNAVATIESGLSNRGYSRIVLDRLSEPGTDPRKILAVFANPEGKRVINESSDLAKLQALFSRAQAYSNSLPQNAMLNNAAAMFAHQLRLRPAGAR